MRRLDARPLLVGKADYFDDLEFEGSYGVFVRSPYAHARIARIDATAAQKAGAKVLTGDMMSVKREVPSAEEKDSTREGGDVSASPLATEKVRYQGEPVAFVMGGSQYEATDFAELVQVEYEPLGAVASIETALGGTSTLFDEFPNNVVLRQSFVYGTMPPPSSRHIDIDAYWGRSLPNPIEPFGVSAAPDGEGVSVVANAQGSQFIAAEVKKKIGIPVKIIPTRHGGSFGAKFSLLKYVTIVAFAAKSFKMPVKWVETRSEHQLASSTSGPERKFKIRAYFTASGEVTGYDCEVWEDVGAAKEGRQALKPTSMLAGPYRIRNLRYTVNNVATNKNPAGAFRGAGTPAHTWMLERVMDAVADELKMGRAELRMKNVIERFPWEAPGAYYESGNPKQLLQAASARNDLFSMRSKDVGVGLSLSTDCSVPGSSASNPGEGMKIRVEKGRVVLGLGYGPEGQGNEHTAILLTAKFLGIPTSRVTYELLDTASSTISFGPGGSRMAVFTAGAVTGAVQELKKALMPRAAEALGTNEVEYHDGHFWGDGGKVSITDLEGKAETSIRITGSRPSPRIPSAATSRSSGSLKSEG